MEEKDQELDQILEELREHQIRRHVSEADLHCFSEGDLSRLDELRIAAHLERCESCRELLAEITAPPSPEEAAALARIRSRVLGPPQRASANRGEAAADSVQPAPAAAAAAAHGSTKWLYAGLAACIALVTLVTLLSRPQPAEVAQVRVSADRPSVGAVSEPTDRLRGPENEITCLQHSSAAVGAVGVQPNRIAGSGAQTLEIQVLDARDQILAQGSIAWDGHSEFFVTLPPTDLAPASYAVQVTAQDGSNRDFQDFEICPEP
ncbi:MAG: hypothetical protein AAF604_11550 [Acidobacteriota bacterium]